MHAMSSVKIRNMASNIELSNKRIEAAKYRIAKCLNMLEATAQELHWACESEEWNDDVAIQVEEAAMKLGFALATLYHWNDSEESFKDELQ